MASKEAYYDSVSLLCVQYSDHPDYNPEWDLFAKTAKA